ncbi:MAG: hypothetical protein P1U61_04260 [Legionellaceae bacterium]|nr:hypothetical protein [Legionellaceae bacterium]
MLHEIQSSGELLMNLKEQSTHIGDLRGSLDTLIKNREDKSYLNRLSLSYGEAAWWQKTLLFIGFLLTGAAVITCFGLSPWWMLPLVSFYGISIYFLSNHHEAHQSINTKTLAVLESTLTESIHAIDAVCHQLDNITHVCSTLYQFQATEHIAFQQRLSSMEQTNDSYQTAVDILNPVAQALNQTEQTTHQKAQELLKLFNETQTTLLEEKEHISQVLTPKLNTSIDSLKDSEAHLSSLKTQFQKNIIYMNAFIDELDELCCQLDSEQSVQKSTFQEDTFEETDKLLMHADEVIEQAMRTLSPSSEHSLATTHTKPINASPTFFRPVLSASEFSTQTIEHAC